MFVFSNVIKPQGLEPLQFPTKFRSHSELDDEEYIIMREDEVLGVIEDADTKRKK